MPTYQITRTRMGWAVQKDCGEASAIHMGSFGSKKEAKAVARLLAGWRGRVVEVRA